MHSLLNKYSSFTDPFVMENSHYFVQMEFVWCYFICWLHFFFLVKLKWKALNMMMMMMMKMLEEKCEKYFFFIEWKVWCSFHFQMKSFDMKNVCKWNENWEKLLIRMWKLWKVNLALGFAACELIWNQKIVAWASLLT